MLLLTLSGHPSRRHDGWTSGGYTKCVQLARTRPAVVAAAICHGIKKMSRSAKQVLYVVHVYCVNLNNIMSITKHACVTFCLSALARLFRP